jgi:hypothetical protein
MSHFNACVFVTRNGSSLEQMADRADNILAKFDINKEMKPYKTYISAEEIQEMAEHYKINPANLPALSEKLKNWTGDKGGVDEKGFYGISTKNPEGHIDHWSIFGEVKPEDRGRFLFGQGGEGKIVKAVVTPDGKWLDGPWIYGSPDADQEKELKEWNQRVSSLLSEYPDAVSFLANCHI